MKLTSKAEKRIFLQDYLKNEMIEGVEIIQLKRFNDDGGSFTELGRLSAGIPESLPGFEVKQVNYSEMAPNAIKAFHIHRSQTDVWFVPPKDKILLILADLREGSPTEAVIMRIPLGDCNSRLIKIPPGVAHGCKNIAGEKGQIIYFVNQIFSADPAISDEGRLPWDFFGPDIWEVEKG
ncbi:MAG: dTDP-4-dehydrorhamnose 3,5-epimerase family protein [Candidatus Marinimicrobia bacterium]|nr:dTDP-4-dehydrorhamnose 3,5-epimerase family protein [Candidatus Neomarinimicrobiota bacterium]